MGNVKLGSVAAPLRRTCPPISFQDQFSTSSKFDERILG